MTNIDDMEYFHKERDSKINAETKPPNDEEIKIPTIWAFEVFPPEYIENFYQSIEQLGWNNNEFHTFNNSQNTLYDMRHRLSGGGWINLGYYLSDKIDTNYPGIKKNKLPNEIKAIRASIFQPIPSTTILICQFFLEEELSNILDNTLKENYKTYKEKTQTGYRFMTPEHQKKDTINLNLEFLNNICSTWLKSNFLGLYASNDIQEEHPVCNLIILEKNIPFHTNNSQNDYLSILNLKLPHDVWKSNKLDGLYLQLPNENNYIRQRLIISGNINEILKNEDIERYGTTKEERIINYLKYLDNTLGTWILNVLLDSYIHKIADLRDSYGKASVDVVKDTISQIRILDFQILQIKKNILPFNLEIKNYIENEKYFLRDIIEFFPIEERFKEERLFSNMRNSISYKIQLLSDNEQILRDTSKAHRELNTVISNDKLSETNIKMQNSMLNLTWVILFFTIVSAISTIVGSWDGIENIWNNINKFK